MKISKKIIDNLKKGGVDFYLSVPCKLLANMIEVLENDDDVMVPRDLKTALKFDSLSYITSFTCKVLSPVKFQ